MRAFIRFTSPEAGTGVLKIHVERSNGFTTRVYSAGDTWTEAGITWNNQPAIGAELGTSTSGWDQDVFVDVPVVAGNNTFAIRKFVGSDPGPISSNPGRRGPHLERGRVVRPTLTVTPAPPPPPPCEGTQVANTENLVT